MGKSTPASIPAPPAAATPPGGAMPDWGTTSPVPATGVSGYRNAQRDPEQVCIVHVKVLSHDPDEVTRVAQMIDARLRDLRVGNRAVKCIVTGENCDVNLADLQPLAARITSIVARSLGVSVNLGAAS